MTNGLDRGDSLIQQPLRRVSQKFAQGNNCVIVLHAQMVETIFQIDHSIQADSCICETVGTCDKLTTQ